MKNLEFKKYRRTNIAEMRKVTAEDIKSFQTYNVIYIDFNPYIIPQDKMTVSISDVDLKNGSPKLGDMIARNPNNHEDLWLVAKEYFENNFEEIL